MLGSFCDPGGILTPNRWSRNPVRYTVAPQSLFWRVVQKSFLKVAPQSRFLAGDAKILFEGCATEPFFHSLRFKPPRMLQIYSFFQGRIHFFQ